MTRRVVLLYAATADPAAAITSLGESLVPAFGAALGDDVTVDAIVLSAPPAALEGVGTVLTLADGPVSALDRALRAVGAPALRDRLARSPAGRLLNSLGPVDAGRVFWRSLRLRPDALALTGPDVIVVAGDLAATRAAWMLHRRGAASRALWGVGAAIEELARERSR
jgi:hypothetical protein